MRPLAPRERRWLAVLLLLLAVAAAWLLLVHPVLDGFAARAAQRRALAFSYTRDARLLDQLPSIGRAAAAQRAQAGRFRLAAADQPAAAARLRALLARCVAAAGGQLRDVEEAAPPPGGVRLRLRADLSAPQLAALLGCLARTPPVLVVDGLRIDAKEDAQPADQGLLDTSLDVSAAYSAAQPR